MQIYKEHNCALHSVTNKDMILKYEMLFGAKHACNSRISIKLKYVKVSIQMAKYGHVCGT